jgi:LAS superfamily LD-carboxypeptidase LdcB
MRNELKIQELQNKLEALINKIDKISNESANKIESREKKEVKPKWESIINIISIAAIPIVVAIGGWLLQKSLQNQSIKRDYVQLSVTILKETDTTKINSDIRNWAVQLLNENSPVKLSATVQNQLKSGEVSLPVSSVEPAKYSAAARSLDSLQPAVADLARKLIAKAKEQGIEVIVMRTYVSPKEQEELYAQGRTKPGPIITNTRRSAHTNGLAFDIIPYKNGQLLFNDSVTYEKLGAIGRSLGLTWGGDWRVFKDYPHFEIRQLDGN